MVDRIDVLHVDEDPSVLDLAETFFGRELESAAVTDVTDPESALERLKSGSFDWRTASGARPRNTARDGSDFGAGGSNSGSADVTVRVGDLKAGFYVVDDGPGIPADVRDDPFAPGQSGIEGNTGFGLAIVTQIAEAHGWTVTATDSAAGGARFEVRGVERPGSGVVEG